MGAVALLVALASGCSADDEPPVTGSGSDAPLGTGGDVPYERVSTDQLSVSPDGAEVLVDCWNGICRWDASSGSLELVPDRGSVAVAPDWSTVAIINGGEVVLEGLESGDPVATLSGLADGVVADGSPATAVAYSPDGTRVAAAGVADDGGGRLLVWSVDGTEQGSFDTVGEIHRLAFSPEGDRIATAGNGSVEVHDLVTGESTEVPSGEGGAVAWSPDGDRLVGPGADDQPVVWETEGWQQVAELPGVRLHEAAFAPDGDRVAVTGLDETAVTLWSPGASGKASRRLEGHVTAPGAVAWSPDGSVIYSVSGDDGVIGWDPDGGEPTDVSFELPEGR